jgi:hypothetical protein
MIAPSGVGEDWSWHKCLNGGMPAAKGGDPLGNEKPVSPATDGLFVPACGGLFR